MSSLGQLLEYGGWLVGGVSVLCSCTKCNTWELSLGPPHPSRLTFLNFCWAFYSHIWDRIGFEKPCREKFMICWKKEFFDYKFIFTFQLDGCMEPTCAVICLIHFDLYHRPDNIRLMLTFFNWNVHSCFQLFVYIFILPVSLECICKSEEISVYNTNVASYKSDWNYQYHSLKR